MYARCLARVARRAINKNNNQLAQFIRASFASNASTDLQRLNLGHDENSVFMKWSQPETQNFSHQAILQQDECKVFIYSMLDFLRRWFVCLFFCVCVCVCVFCREMGDAYYVINRFDCFLDFDRSISFSAFGILVDFLSLSLSLVWFLWRSSRAWSYLLPAVIIIIFLKF